MDLSIPTLQFTDFVVFAISAVVFFVCWLLQPMKRHFLLFSASFALCAGLSVWFVDFGYYGSIWSTVGWVLAGSLFWSGFRVFDGRSPVTLAMVLFGLLPAGAHLTAAAVGLAGDQVNMASTLAYAMHEAAVARYVYTAGVPRSPTRKLAAFALLMIAVAICLPLLPIPAEQAPQMVIVIFIVDHITTILLTTLILALEAERAYLAMEHQARTDPLTKVLNREGLSQALKGHGGHAGFILADLDHFKSINDRFGHAAGDEVLREFAERAAALMPEGGHIARLGGEEFVLVVTGREVPATVCLAEALRLIVQRLPIPWNGGAIGVTVSLGVALSNSRSELLTVLERADGALYAAKQAGRNQVRVA